MHVHKPTLLEKFAQTVTHWTGTSAAFALAAGAIVVWLVTGPVFEYSNTWQLVINTGTTIVTFLMVFLIQRSQNKEALALHLKLNELLAAVEGASNRLINVEDLTEAEVQTLHRHFERLVELAKHEHDFLAAHSIEETEGRHRRKYGKFSHEQRSHR
jgi:low affinity Fe/Cu permease